MTILDAPPLPPLPPLFADPAESSPPPDTSRSGGLVSRARWERPALGVLLLAVAVLYIWGLDASGWANSFYSAAAQAGSASWKAFFYGSSDAANAITVDKPPASLWIMGLSVRIFGLSSWSLLVPEALMGVATVGVVFATVRRWFTARAAFIAAAVLALTPVATLMFKFNNPDALLVLLMSIAAYTTLRGIAEPRRRWVVATGVLLGFGFLTKQLQVLLVLPPFAFAHLVAARSSVKRRLTDLLTAGVAMVLAAGWWIAIVELVPASMRPYIGGSQNNSILELTLGYNGLGRLSGNETGSVGGGGNGGGQWGETGITRMFSGVIGTQIAWLLPTALVLLATGLWITRRAPRADPQRASLLVWGGWLLVTGLTFSFMAGIFHEYYTVALAPAIGALVGIGADQLWTRRHSNSASVVLASTILLTAGWAWVLVGRASGWGSWLRPVVVAAGVFAAASVLAVRFAKAPRQLLVAAGAAAIVAGLAAPAAWSLQTATTGHSGSIVTAGPAVAGSRGGPGGAGGFPGRGGNGQPPAMGNGALPTIGAAPTNGVAPGNGGAPTAGNGPTGGGGMGGLLDSADVSDQVAALLEADAGDYTWVAAAVGSNRASGFQLATEEPVMAIGGFNGSDPSPTLAEFQEYVASGQIHYFISGGGFGQSMGGSSESGSIADWVSSNFTATTVDGVTLYDLTS